MFNQNESFNRNISTSKQKMLNLTVEDKDLPKEM